MIRILIRFFKCVFLKELKAMNKDLGLKSLSNTALIEGLKSRVSEERRIGIEILHFLSAVESRRLYAELGYSSLWEFCVKECAYSEGSAQRRISAMRAMVQVP